MGSISQMAEKCQNCPERKYCDRKRMEACAYIEDPNLVAPVSENTGASATAPILRETVHVCIGGASGIIYKDDLEKLLYEKLHKSLSCAFNSGA